MSKLESVEIRDFSEGIYRRSAIDNVLIPKNSVQHSINVNYDTIIGSAVVRSGTTLLGATVAANKTPLGLSEFTTAGGATNLALSVFSGVANASVYYYNTVWNTSGLTTLNNTAKCRFAQLANRVFIANGADAMKSSSDGNTWNTTNCITTDTVLPSLLFKTRGRLLASGDGTGTGANRNRSRVWFSSVVDSSGATGTITWDTSATGNWIDINPDDGCYDEKTEILTDSGWKFFKDLEKNERVLTLNPKTREMEWQKPNAYITKEYKGELIHFISKTLDIFVTPNHNIVIIDPKKDTLRLIRADKVKKYSGYSPRTAKWVGEEPEKIFGMKAEVFMKFLGIYLAEGYSAGTRGGNPKKNGYKTGISQIKGKTKSEIREMLKETSFHFKEYGNNFILENKKVWSYFFQLGNSYDRYIPQEIKNLSPRLLSILAEWMIKGDGNKWKNKETYYTVSKKLADDFQEILLKIGKSGHIYERKDIPHFIKGKFVCSQRIQYKVSIITSKNAYFCDSKETYIHKEDYLGKIYCVEVPNHILYVRRNGKGIFCGNSDVTGFAEVGGLILVFKARSIGSVVGSGGGLGGGLYRLYTVSKTADADNLYEVGAVSQEAITTCRGYAYFFTGQDIRRTNGDYPELVSRNIQDFIDAIPQSSWANVALGNDGWNVYASIGNVTVPATGEDSVTYNNVVLKFSTRDGTWSVHSYGNAYRMYSQFTTTAGGRTFLGSTTAGDVQTINSGTTDNGTAISFDLWTQEQEFGNKASTKEISDPLIVYTRYGLDSIIQYRTKDEEDWKPANMVLTNRINYGRDFNAKGNTLTLRWNGISSNKAPILQGFYIPNIGDGGLRVVS